MPFPGTTYGSPHFVAHAMVNKFQYGLPFYRQEMMFERGGLPVSRTTLANLAIKVSEIGESIIQAFRHELHSQAHISADETSIQCLKERCAVLWPHGVLFRNEEQAMRAKMVEQDWVEAVIGLGPKTIDKVLSWRLTDTEPDQNGADSA